MPRKVGRWGRDIPFPEPKPEVKSSVIPTSDDVVITHVGTNDLFTYDGMHPRRAGERIASAGRSTLNYGVQGRVSELTEDDMFALVRDVTEGLDFADLEARVFGTSSPPVRNINTQAELDQYIAEGRPDAELVFGPGRFVWPDNSPVLPSLVRGINNPDAAARFREAYASLQRAVVNNGRLFSQDERFFQLTRPTFPDVAAEPRGESPARITSVRQQRRGRNDIPSRNRFGGRNN